MNKKIIALPFFLVLFYQGIFAQQTILTDSNLPIMVITTDIDPNTNAPYEILDIQSPLDTILLDLNKNDKREQKFLLSGNIDL